MHCSQASRIGLKLAFPMPALQRLLPVNLSARIQADRHQAVAGSGGGKPREGGRTGSEGIDPRATSSSGLSTLLMPLQAKGYESL